MFENPYRCVGMARGKTVYSLRKTCWQIGSFYPQPSTGKTTPHPGTQFLPIFCARFCAHFFAVLLVKSHLLVRGLYTSSTALIITIVINIKRLSQQGAIAT